MARPIASDKAPGGPARAAAELIAILARAGLIGAGEEPKLAPLAGGVASDIWKVETGTRTFCVKRALPKLRVEQDWYVPVERNANEAGWIEIINGIEPDAAPKLLAHVPEAGLLAMEYLPPESFPVWKSLLRDGHADPDFAAEVGRRLGRIHAATAGRQDIAARFASDAIFHAIRLEAYLETAAGAHGDLSDALMALSRRTLTTRRALVHGDVSPKNILAGPRGPVFLDAECAWYGDPAFDVAFCLNHLLLKCLWTPSARDGFERCFTALAGAYLGEVAWEPATEIEARAASLLPGLFLARVDGKSPAEYVTRATDKAAVRRTAAALLRKPPARLSEVWAAWMRELAR